MHRLTSLLAATALLGTTACGTGTQAETPSPTAPAAESAAGTAPATRGATATESPETTASDEAAFDEAAECENEEIGYEVAYPADWWANERISVEEPTLTPIAACTYFAPDPVELQPNAGLPNGIAIRIEERAGQTGTTGDVLSRDETTVDGHAAIVWETEPAPQTGFIPEGALLYQYLIELDGGGQLVATTDSILQDEAAYEESREILDAMMETLELDG